MIDFIKIIKSLLINFKNEISNVKLEHDLNILHSKYLGKKSKLLEKIILPLKNTSISQNEKNIIWKEITNFKNNISNSILQKRNDLIEKEIDQQMLDDKEVLQDYISFDTNNKLHLFTYEIRRIKKFFLCNNFYIVSGSEVTTIDYNFTLLNIDMNHPAISNNDTYYLTLPEHLLRTHTTNVTSYYLKNFSNYNKVVGIGKVYRNDTIDANHFNQFFQIDGFIIENNMTLKKFKNFIDSFLAYFFAPVKIKSFWRVSYFPFTSPSFEIDLECFKCIGKGCNYCHLNGKIEICGLGVLHENVLKFTNHSIKEKTLPVAFGIGIDRLVMLKYEIFDIRNFYSGNKRFLLF